MKNRGIQEEHQEHDDLTRFVAFGLVAVLSQ